MKGLWFLLERFGPFIFVGMVWLYLRMDPVVFFKLKSGVDKWPVQLLRGREVRSSQIYYK